MPRTWILTGSPENHAATRAHDFAVIGLKERNRNRALEIEPGDRIVLYSTRVMAFAGSMRVDGELYEERSKIWPGKPGKAEPYPWRFPTSPEIVLDETAWIPAASLVDELEHIGKWPREHWKLDFQGQIRAVSDHVVIGLLDRMRVAGGGRTDADAADARADPDPAAARADPDPADARADPDPADARADPDPADARADGEADPDTANARADGEADPDTANARADGRGGGRA